MKEVELREIYPFLSEMLECGNSISFKPNGTSMLPLLRQGLDSVVLAKPKNAPKKHDIVFYRRSNGQFVLHRAVNVRNGIYTMCGDNQWEKERGITADMIIGIVTQLKRGGTPVDINAAPYSIYCRLLPLRRTYLFLRKAVSFVLRRLKCLFK